MSPQNAFSSVPVMLATLILGCLAGCGGGSEGDDFQSKVAQANAKEAEAKALATDTPCQSTSQCGTLMFVSPTAQCTSVSYHPYLLVSPTAAAASSAAAKQRELALEATSAAPDQDRNLACPQGFPASPELTCNASKCQTVQ